MDKKDSKINGLLENLGEPIEEYREWDLPKKYPFPVYRKKIGSLIKVYKINNHKEKFEKLEDYKKIADDYYKAEIGKQKK